MINEVLSFNTSTLADEDGDYPDWIEFYNPSNTTLSLDKYSLSDDRQITRKWVFPNISIKEKSFLIAFASGKDRKGARLHLNFKIKSKGETLFLFSPSGSLIDSLTVPPLSVDQSFARIPDGSTAWSVAAYPTPGSSNSLPYAILQNQLPLFSHPPGFHHGGLRLSLTARDSLRVFYTLDGSSPHIGSSLFTLPIPISKTTVVKARVVDREEKYGPVVTHTYIVDHRSSIPVISLSTDPNNLFHDDIGIYVVGNSKKLGGYPDNPISPPANYWEDWERPVHLELFEPDGSLGFSIDAGIKMFGKTTRKLPQKSFAVFLRNGYGLGELDYPLFPRYPIRRFKSFLLRNAGSDNTYNEGGVQFRDGLAAQLLYGLDLEFQAYRPCHLYINGEYWGIYNLREKINEDYLTSHHGVDPKKVDLLDDYHRLYPLALEGDASHFNALIDFLRNHSLAVQANADYTASQMDVKNYLTYMAIQVILANHDGPGHNCKFWRPNNLPAPYRWILYDVDHSFGLRLFIPNYHYAPQDGYKDNTISYYREQNGPSWPNPPESTFLFRKILENQGFRELFINTVADLLNTRFSVDFSLAVFDSIQSVLQPEIDHHLRRWGGQKNIWLRNAQVVRTFLQMRPDYVYDHLITEFSLEGLVKVSLAAEPKDAGIILLNSLTIDADQWNGLYFQRVPLRICAVSSPEYRFSGWKEISSLSPSLSLSLDDDVKLTAQFEKIEKQPALIINEINYNSPPFLNSEDWIEFFNPFDQYVDISNWAVTDGTGNQFFLFPNHTIICPHQYIVVCRNQRAFCSIWKDVFPLFGDFPFGLKGGEQLVLLNENRTVVDSVTFQSTWPWPLAADGKGATLALRQPFLDRSQPKNWFASFNGGTPGRKNDMVGEIKDISYSRFGALTFCAFPNPFNNAISIFLETTAKQHVRVNIFDVLGRRVKGLYEGYCEGHMEFVWNPQYFPTGIYFLAVINEEERIKQIKKIIYIK